MGIYYEWDIETTDEFGDVLDHHHADKLKDLPALDEGESLVLVRNEGNEFDGVTDRLWAYVADGSLPSHFYNSKGLPTGYAVPKRFHAEFARSAK